MASYWRLHFGPVSPDDLHDRHVSRLWVGEDQEARAGLSVCETYDDLVTYFAGGTRRDVTGRGATMRDAYLVELEGEPSGDEPYEEEGEVLIHPTRILSCAPVLDTDFVAHVVERIAEYRRSARRGERVRYDASRDQIVIEEP